MLTMGGSVMSRAEQHQKRPCAVCGKEIEEFAISCSCGAQYELIKRGYCQSCQQDVALSSAGKCPNCDGDEVVNMRMESNLLSPQPGMAAATAPTMLASVPTMQMTPKMARAIRRARNVGVTIGPLAYGGQIALYFATVILLVLSVFSFAIGLGTYTSASQLDDVSFVLWGISGTQYSFAPLLYVILAIVTLAVQPKALKMRADKATRMKVKRNLRQNVGATSLLRAKHNWTLPIRWTMTLTVWLVMGGLMFYYYGQITDRQLDIKPGFYITAACVVVGIVSTILMWPFGGRHDRLVVGFDGSLTPE